MSKSFNPELWGGIECTINRVGEDYFDQLEIAGHYNRPADMELIASVGFKKFRYPVLWERHCPERNSIPDFSLIKERLEFLRSKEIDPIAGLVHHGSGPKYTSLLDENFPVLFADYSYKVAKEFPWLEYYTPINEPGTTARFSGLYGLWYPHEKDRLSFYRMLLNEMKATVLAMKAIRSVNPAAKLVQTEDLGKTYSTPSLQYQSDYENSRRNATFDLLFGNINPDELIFKYMLKYGIKENELQFFVENKCPPDIIGYNYYATSERFLDDRLDLYPDSVIGGNDIDQYVDVEAVRIKLNEPSGLEFLLNESFKRYPVPTALTEVHLNCTREEQIRWFDREWQIANKLSSEGKPLIAVTAWAVFGSYGWETLLTGGKWAYEPGVFDLRSANPRLTAVTHYLNSLSSGNSPFIFTNEKGWWERDERFLHYKKNGSFSNGQAKSKPILITGKNGTLGKAFAKAGKERGINYILLAREDLDISDKSSVAKFIEEINPWAIINAAGYVRVDDAEMEQEKCFADNYIGALNLAQISSDKNIPFLTFSSDLVFSGEKNSPYVETDIPTPLNIYGKSKLKAEQDITLINPHALIVRTSAFFSPYDRYNFIYAAIDSLRKEKEFITASDQIISPTLVSDLVRHSLDLLIDGENGIWHLTNKGALSWSELAHKVAEFYNLNSSFIKSVSTAELNQRAVRPPYSALESERAQLMPTLDDALERYFALNKFLDK